MKCHKVILVTHSMGGLVARYYSECLTEPGPGRDKIYGIVHGVMPSIGAAATYTRMKRGTENPESGMAGAAGYVTSHVLWPQRSGNGGYWLPSLPARWSYSRQ